ncbi:MAG TPA: hypothetical protein ENN88_03900 [Candidatus Coatesbacteria bacterium]|nr:hypothetical protein [Candidatus Coatesbacteria bacterium]
MFKLPAGVWPLARIENAVRRENAGLPEEEVHRRAREIFSFMLRDADRWFSSGRRLNRIRAYLAGRPDA